MQSRRPGLPGGRADTERVIERFMAATSSGDLQGLMDVLAPDVVVLSDGGGKVSAAHRPVVTADKVARLLIGLTTQATGALAVATGDDRRTLGRPGLPGRRWRPSALERFRTASSPPST